MDVTLVPLLRIEREIYHIARGRERFDHYLKTMIGGTDDLLYPPLVALNPMGREHVAETIDVLIALDAEAVALEALEDAARRLPAVEGSFKLGLVVADDLKGGWTNRQFSEIGNRFAPQSLLKRGWLSTLFWTSESPDAETVRREVLATVYRTAHFLRHGPPRTLRAMMEQEGRAAAFAGMTSAGLDAEELAYSRVVIEPLLESDDPPVQFAALYGDAAAKAVGYTPLGLSPRAGFAVALAGASA